MRDANNYFTKKQINVCLLDFNISVKWKSKQKMEETIYSKKNYE